VDRHGATPHGGPAVLARYLGHRAVLCEVSLQGIEGEGTATSARALDGAMWAMSTLVVRFLAASDGTLGRPATRHARILARCQVSLILAACRLHSATSVLAALGEIVNEAPEGDGNESKRMHPRTALDRKARTCGDQVKPYRMGNVPTAGHIFHKGDYDSKAFLWHLYTHPCTQHIGRARLMSLSQCCVCDSLKVKLRGQY